MPAGWRAPQADGELLADPDFATAAQLAQGHFSPDAPARREILDAATAYLRERGEPVPPVADGPLIVTGHQPELFHPGVWAKNFAAAGLAHRTGGVALNLIADSDTLKSRTLRLPAADGSRVEVVPFDDPAAEVPYQLATLRSPTAFARAWETLHAQTAAWPFRPLLPDLRPATGEPIGEAFSRVRRVQERAWGCHNFELPVSRLCQTAAWAGFVELVEARRTEFTAVYNAAIHDYRLKHRVRSANHPAPLLEPGERPFWRITRGGRERPFASYPAAELRPRALTLTLFVRTAFADLFIHGIGGGLYDRVTDDIIRRFLGVEPPPYQVLTLTARLPFPAAGDPAADLRDARRLARARSWNPQRFADDRADAETRRAVQGVEAAIALSPTTRRGRRHRFHEIRTRKADLADRLRLTTDDDAITAATTRLARAAVLGRRDYPWVMFPEATLRPLLTGLT